MPYKNPEDRKAYNDRYRVLNLERLNAYDAARNEIRKAERAAKRRQIQDAITEEERNLILSNRQQAIKEYTQQYYELNKNHIKEQKKKYQKDNAAAIRERERNYWKSNPDKATAKRHKRRGALKGLPFPIHEWKDRLDRFGDYCPYCDTKGHKLTLDHVIPITLGGTNDIWNLVPCCISCNCSKNNKLLWEWKPGFNFLHLMEYF